MDLGQIYLIKKDFPAAESAFRMALEADSRIDRTRVALAQLYSATGNHAKAEQELLQATRDDPENDGLLHALGSFYTSTRQLDEMVKLYLDLLKRKPESIVAKKRLAELYASRKDLKKARVYSDQILTATPADTDGLFFRGLLYLAENQVLKAINDFSVVTRNSPRFALAFYFLGQSQVRQSQIEEAKKASQRLLNCHPIGMSR